MRERIREHWLTFLLGLFLLLISRIAAFPQTVPPISLPDTTGAIHTQKDWAAKRAVVLVFVTTDCPVGNSYVPELNRIARDYAGRGVALYAVASDPTQSAAEVRKYAAEFGYQFPLLLDPKLSLARGTGATTMPEAAVLSPSGQVLYLGRIDDRVVDFGKARPQARQHDLRDALDAVLAGKPVAHSRTRAIGCAIPFGA